MSSVDILVKGRNRALLFDKLNKAGVAVLSSKSVGNDIVIRVKYKDLKKAFAILKKTWYNKPVKYNGAIGLKRFLIKNLAVAVSVVAFFSATFVLDGFVLFTKTEGVSFSKKTEIERVLEESGVGRFSRFKDLDERAIELNIMRAVEGIEFVSVSKSANTLVITAVEEKPETRSVERKKHLVAERSGVIKEAKVLRGKLLKSVGEGVLVGETVVEGVIEDGENLFDAYVVAEITIACEYVAELYLADNGEETVKNALAAERTFLGATPTKEEYSLAPSGGGYLMKIKFEYLFTQSGGEIE